MSLNYLYHFENFTCCIFCIVVLTLAGFFFEYCFEFKKPNSWLDIDVLPGTSDREHFGLKYVSVSSIIFVRCIVALNLWIPASINWPWILLNDELIIHHQVFRYYVKAFLNQYFWAICINEITWWPIQSINSLLWWQREGEKVQMLSELLGYPFLRRLEWIHPQN